MWSCEPSLCCSCRRCPEGVYYSPFPLSWPGSHRWPPVRSFDFSPPIPFFPLSPSFLVNVMIWLQEALAPGAVGSIQIDCVFPSSPVCLADLVSVHLQMQQLLVTLLPGDQPPGGTQVEMHPRPPWTWECLPQIPSESQVSCFQHPVLTCQGRNSALLGLLWAPRSPFGYTSLTWKFLLGWLLLELGLGVTKAVAPPSWIPHPLNQCSWSAQKPRGDVMTWGLEKQTVFRETSGSRCKQIPHSHLETCSWRDWKEEWVIH